MLMFEEWNGRLFRRGCEKGAERRAVVGFLNLRKVVGGVKGRTRGIWWGKKHVDMTAVDRWDLQGSETSTC